jgi:monoamine oxidase
MRIPHHHESVIRYCRELGVPLESFNNTNEGAYYYSDGGRGPLANRRIRQRELHSDLRGYTAELLAKAFDQSALDLPLSAEDKRRSSSTWWPKAASTPASSTRARPGGVTRWPPVPTTSRARWPKPRPCCT